MFKISCKVKRVNKSHNKRSNNRIHQPWYSDQCELLRKRIRRSGVEVSKDPFNRSKQTELASAKRDYNRLLRKLKKDHRSKVIEELETLNSANNIDFWPLLKKLRRKKNVSSVDMAELSKHFETLLNKPSSTISEEQKQKEEEVTKFIEVDRSQLHSDLRAKYTETNICNLISSLKNGKSAYKDGVLNEVLKYAKPSLTPILVKLFNLVEDSGNFPAAWSGNFLVPLFKKGNPTDASNYRGLAVGSNLCKLYTKALNKKLTSYCDTKNIISPYQFGFRADHRTTDSIFVLKSVLSHYKTLSKKPVYACFVDLSKAFDSINRTDLLYKLGQYGIAGNILQVIKSMYTDITYSIKSNGKYSTSFSSTHGVKQGCNLSPLLFNLFINDIHNAFDSSCKPVSIDQQKFSSISFADDIVILSETPEGLQNSLNNIQEYCEKWGLKINCDKTKVVEFNKPFRQKRPRAYFMAGEYIEVCKQFCYLGVEITSTGSFHCTMDRACNKARKALYSLYAALNIYSNEGNIPLFIKLFNILIKPILTYGSEVWGYHCIKTGSPISKFINKFYKTLLGVPAHTSTTAIHLELDCTPIEDEIKCKLLKYWYRIVQLPDNRLAKQCYNTLLADGAKDQISSAVKTILSDVQMDDIWKNQTTIIDTKKHLVKRQISDIVAEIHNRSKSSLLQKAQSESKLKYFIETSSDYIISEYLLLVKNRESRSSISKIRSGVLDLAIETGRRKNVPKEKRMCNQCNNNIIEDELHFMFDCTAYIMERHSFLNMCSGSISNIYNMSHLQKLKSILNSSNSILLNQFGMFITKIHKIRKALVNI